MRIGTVNRKTAETVISLTLNLDGSGIYLVDTGCGFLDHMLTLLAVHSGYDLSVTCQGDTRVDDHHTVEDIGIALGVAFCEAIGEKIGIARYGDRLLPMDETLILSAVDISGRGAYYGDLKIPTAKVGSFDTELVQEFFLAFAREAKLTLHVRQLSGTNSHHIIEGVFKSVARALSAATAEDAKNLGKVPSSKGVL